MSQQDLQERFPQMKPVKSAPSVITFNGCGVGMYGHRDHDEQTGTYVSTQCICLVFVPLFCLRAFRVARAERGWYFIGREPLSAFARRWNLLLLAVIAGSISFAAFSAHTSTPAYKARRQMADAQSLVAGGRLADAAKIYQALTLAGADQSTEATAALEDLLTARCAQAPVRESAGVFAAAAQLARRTHGLDPKKLTDQAIAIAQVGGNADPASAVALLDAVRPLAVDTRPVDAARLPLLKAWATAEPDNLKAVCPLASLLLEQDKSDEAKALLMPLKDHLGDGEGARVLGLILAHDGDNEGAYRLLWPYAQPRLARLHAAEQDADRIGQQLWDREVDALKHDKGPRAFYDKMENASDEQKRALVREYVQVRINNDPALVTAQETLERETAVVPVALELGIIMLQRGQAKADPAERKSDLEAAEKVFLAVGGVAGESDTYRTSLGQVYYWLGRQAEGRKLLDEYLAAKQYSAQASIGVASLLRNLGAEPEARKMAEAAYASAKTREDKQMIAGFRAVCGTDNDDEITWLSRADADNPLIRARLAHARGEKAAQAGRDDEAAEQFRLAAAACESLARSATALNGAARAYTALFHVSGDRQSLQKCADLVQQALDLEPGDTILLFNAGAALRSAAMTELIADSLDVPALRRPGSLTMLSALYDDEAGRADLAQRLIAHPGTARATSYLKKGTVLSPKSRMFYAELYEQQSFARDQQAMEELARQMKAAAVETSDAVKDAQDAVAGVHDDRDRAIVAAALKRCEALATSLRPRGDRTAAIAIALQADMMLSPHALGVQVDASRLVALAEEAQRLCPCRMTRRTLQAAYLFRAARELAAADPRVKSLLDKCRRTLSDGYVLAYLASEPGPMQQRVLQHPDVQKVLLVVHENAVRFAQHRSVWDWAMLRNSDPSAAEEAARVIRQDPSVRTGNEIELMLSPASASDVMEAYWLGQITGDMAAANEAIARVAKFGVPLPMQP